MSRIYVADKETLDKVARAVGVEGDNKIYGIKINKKDSNPNTRCTYLADAVGMTPASMNFSTGEFNYGDWADAWFVKDNFPCMLKPNGAVAYKLDPNDYSKKEDGTASDITDTSTNLNAMSAMPLVWIWQYEIGDFKYIYLANYKVNDNYRAYAHQREDGSVAPYVFMSIFKGVDVVNSSERYFLRSLSGLQPDSGRHTLSGLKQYAEANAGGSSIYWGVKTWSQRNLMQCLLTMILCSTDSQSKLGMGNVYGGRVPLVTGTLNTNGQFWGSPDAYTQVKAFHQEAVWGDSPEAIMGIFLNNDAFYVKMTPPYSFDTTQHKVVAGVKIEGPNSAYIVDTCMTEYGDFPIKLAGSYSMYECDSVLYVSDESSFNCISVGGDISMYGSGLYALKANFNPGVMTCASLSCLP